MSEEKEINILIGIILVLLAIILWALIHDIATDTTEYIVDTTTEWRVPDDYRTEPDRDPLEEYIITKEPII